VVVIGVAILGAGWLLAPPFARQPPRATGSEVAEDARAPVAATTAPAPGPRAVTPAELAAMLPRKDFVLVNVHVPYQDEIPGTDMQLAYDRIEASADRLPARKTTPLVVYCRSGGMSAIAARTLVRLGYSNVRDLSGGMAAWVEAGYQLLGRRR
jgi:rhodanese-related sulfurtransferase